MNVQRLPLSQLKPAPYNPRIKLAPGDPAWEKLERSLAEFDLVQPVVWNCRTGHVVAGHQRVEVLRHRGTDEVDCVVVDLPLDREQALNITLNNPSVGSDWDTGRLIDLLEELQDLPDFDATLTGFDEQQLRDLVLTPALNSDLSREPAQDADDGNRNIEATLEIPPDRWDNVRATLDELLADEPQVRLHVTFR